jgi:adhesin HecA-like repeat protein
MAELAAATRTQYFQKFIEFKENKMKSVKFFALSLLALVVMFAAVPMTAAKGDKAPGEKSIVAIAAGNPDFSILVDLVVFAELDGVLANDGQFTVFAPTNAAFIDLINALDEAVGQEKRQELLSDKEFVTDVLLYHVTDGRRFSNSVFNRNVSKSIHMLNGGTIMANPNLTITDSSALTNDAGVVADSVNISASNGVIHVIDAVLVP